MKEILSRRGIVGFIAALAAAPKAVEAQAMEVLRDQVFNTDEMAPPMGAAGHQRLTLEQMAMKPFWVEANRKARMEMAAIRRCHSMSPAAKAAYIKAAQEKSAPILLKFSKLMGWIGPDADESDIHG